MPAYTILRPPSWLLPADPVGPSAPPASGMDQPGSVDVTIPRTQPSYHPSYHAHPNQQITDPGPQIRHSRLPLFKQVRSMLHRPPPITTPNDPKWDEYTGELSASGKPSSVQPSNYVSPFDGAFKSSRKRSPQRTNKFRRNQSPVSILKDEEVTPVEAVAEDGVPMDVSMEPRSPVSPVSAVSQADDESDHEDFDHSLVPEPLSPNIQRAVAPGPRTPTNSQQIKRKPVSRDFSAENYPPLSPKHSPSQSSDMNGEASADAKDTDRVPPKSHFSWTTYANSILQGRASIDTVAAKDFPDVPKSRFSWSTVATTTTQAQRAESPPPSPPPLPAEYANAPVQSILSRRRPVQRIEKEPQIPPAPPRTSRSADQPRAPTLKTPSSSTPSSATTIKTTLKSLTPTTYSPSTTKALPPPPHLNPSTTGTTRTHLETLLLQERDLYLQRRNVEHAIGELEKIETASPLDVSFSSVRRAKRRLADYRARLAEVRLEERDIGVAIARARRREEKENGGDGETLWVRRVTG